MFRSRFLLLAGALALPALATAQTPFDAKVAQAMTATWKMDKDRSEPVPGPAAQAGEPQRGDPAAAVGGAPTRSGGGGGGGSGRRGGGGGGSGASGEGNAGLGARRGGSASMRNPYIRDLMVQMQAPELMDFAAGADNIAIKVGEVEVDWTPDGKKHQSAQMDGTLLLNAATWKGNKLELIDGVEGAMDLKREIRLIDDGQALEMKLELGGPSLPKKITRKVVYVRQ